MVWRQIWAELLLFPFSLESSSVLIMRHPALGFSTACLLVISVALQNPGDSTRFKSMVRGRKLRLWEEMEETLQ